MTIVMLGDMRMFYEETGNRDGMPLILLHGFNGSSADWVNHHDRLGKRYRLIVPDLRGHGRSDSPAGLAAMNHQQFARDVIALCGTLGIERTALCGNSTGAMLLLALVSQAPTLAGACVMSAGTYYFPDHVRDMFRRFSPDALPEAMQARFQEVHTALGPDHWRIVTMANHALHAHAHEDDFPPEDDLGTFDVPFLIVHGDRDPALPVSIATTLYERLPRAELCVLPNTGHAPPREHPEWFQTIVLDFLARHYDV